MIELKGSQNQNTFKSNLIDRQQANRNKDQTLSIQSFSGIQTTQGPDYQKQNQDNQVIQDKAAILILSQNYKSKERSIASDSAQKCLKIYNNLSWFKYLILICYLLLAFFQKPFWCKLKIKNGNITTELKARLENDCDAAYWPRWGLPFLGEDVGNVLEVIFLLILLGFTYYRRFYRISTKSSKIIEGIHTFLTVVALIDIIISWVVHYPHIIAIIIRPILFIFFVRKVRESWKRVSIVLWRSKEIIFLIIVFIIFFSFLGYRLFRGLGQGQAYFPSLPDAMFHLLVLLTTANYPDVMMPAYKVNRLYVLFFIAYLVIGLFFLLNMLLAVFYNNYSEQIEQITNKYLQNQKKANQDKFLELDKEGKGYIEPSRFESMMSQFDQQKQDFERKGSKIARAMTAHSRNQVQQDNTGKAMISKEKVIQTLETYDMIQREKQQADWMNNYDIDQDYQQDEQQNNKRCFDKCYFKCSKIRKKSKVVLQSTIYELVVNFINFINLIALLIRDVLEAEDLKYYNQWSIAQIIINFLFLIDLVLRFWIHTPIAAMKVTLVKFQLVIQIIMFVGFITFLRDQPQFSLKCFEFIIMVRLLRVLYLLQQVFTYNIIMQTLLALIGPFTTLLGVLMTIFYFFSIVGGIIFGGTVDSDLPQTLANDGISTIYIYNNFNDFGSGIITLFELMIVNNWQVIVAMFIDATGNSTVRWYFIVFYFFSVTVALNIVVAFALDIFDTYSKLMHQRRTQKRKMYEELQNGTHGDNGGVNSGKMGKFLGQTADDERLFKQDNMPEQQ